MLNLEAPSEVSDKRASHEMAVDKGLQSDRVDQVMLSTILVGGDDQPRPRKRKGSEGNRSVGGKTNSNKTLELYECLSGQLGSENKNMEYVCMKNRKLKIIKLYIVPLPSLEN